MRGGADRVRVADRLNVAERLAEGRPAAEHTQSYVRACHLVGYQHPDLTAYPAQIHDWYGSEDGLDLHALDADCAQLRAAASVLMEALRMERSQVAVLAAAWTGSGADAAVHFVQRHCETGNSVVTEVRAAAQRCESLRDNLWQLVDSKSRRPLRSTSVPWRSGRHGWLRPKRSRRRGQIGRRPSKWFANRYSPTWTTMFATTG